MRVLMLTMVALLVVALAGLEMVMSALPDEPITPVQVRQTLDGSRLQPDAGGSALPADTTRVPALLCSDEPPSGSAATDDSAGF